LTALAGTQLLRCYVVTKIQFILTFVLIFKKCVLIKQIHCYSNKMSTPLEQQTDEREALQSIYEGDDNFKEIDLTTYQYKVRTTLHTSWPILNICF